MQGTARGAWLENAKNWKQTRSEGDVEGVSRGSTGTLSLYALQDYQDILVMYARYINLIVHANRQRLRRDLLHNGVGFTEIAYSK